MVLFGKFAGSEVNLDGEELVVQGDLLSVDGQVVRAIFREGKYRMVRRVLRRIYKNNYPYFRGTRRSYYSSMATNQDVRLLKKRLVSYPLVKSRSQS